MQSGCPIFTTRSNNATEIAFQIGQAVDNTFLSNDSRELLEVLQRTPAEKLLKVRDGTY